MVRNPGGKTDARRGGSHRIGLGPYTCRLACRPRAPHAIGHQTRTRHPMKRLLPTAASLALVLAAFCGDCPGRRRPRDRTRACGNGCDHRRPVADAQAAAALAEAAPSPATPPAVRAWHTCRGCHGIEGYKNAYPSYKVPKIGGQSQAYLNAALTEYRSGGNRKHLTMQAQAQSFSEQDIADIAAYLSSLREPRHDQDFRDPVVRPGRRAGSPPAASRMPARCCRRRSRRACRLVLRRTAGRQRRERRKLANERLASTAAPAACPAMAQTATRRSSRPTRRSAASNGLHRAFAAGLSRRHCAGGNADIMASQAKTLTDQQIADIAAYFGGAGRCATRTTSTEACCRHPPDRGAARPFLSFPEAGKKTRSRGHVAWRGPGLVAGAIVLHPGDAGIFLRRGQPTPGVVGKELRHAHSSDRSSDRLQGRGHGHHPCPLSA